MGAEALRKAKRKLKQEYDVDLVPGATMQDVKKVLKDLEREAVKRQIEKARHKQDVNRILGARAHTQKAKQPGPRNAEFSTEFNNADLIVHSMVHQANSAGRTLGKRLPRSGKTPGQG